MKSRILNLVITGVLVMFVSCNRDENEPENIDGDALIASSTVDFTDQFDFNTAIDLGNTYSSFSSRTSSTDSELAVPSCATVTVNNTTPGVFPKVITVDYGTTGCTQNNITRKGVLTITISNYIMQNGSTVVIERENYFVNNKKIEGTVTYTNQTTNASTPQWTRTVTNGKVTLQNGLFFTHTGTRTVKQTQGVSTAMLGDNVYEVISGTHTVTRPNGSSLTSTVVTPLVKAFSCHYVSQGQLDLNGTVLDGVLDFGNGNCDNQATYTHSNGTVYQVNL
jgi:hypothetical protein